jgi:hypothetical protein
VWFYVDGIPTTWVNAAPYAATIASGTVTAKAYALYAQDTPVVDADAAALGQLRGATSAPIFRYGAVPLDRAPTIVTQLGIAVGRGPEAGVVAKAMTSGLDALAQRLASEAPVRTLIEGAGFTGYGPASPAGLAVAVDVLGWKGLRLPTAALVEIEKYRIASERERAEKRIQKATEAALELHGVTDPLPKPKRAVSRHTRRRKSEAATAAARRA